MPELPEVETVARQLKPRLSGRRIEDLEVVDAKLKIFPKKKILAAGKVLDVYRLGKQVVVEFEKGYLVVHLRMTGRLICRKKNALADQYTRISFVFDRGVLDFVDLRRFGTIDYSLDLEEFVPEGLEPTAKGFSFSKFTSLAENSKQGIKTWLLRQDKVVGIGNIYASEILFKAMVHPERSVSSLSKSELKKIFNSTKSVLNKAIENCGTTFSDFQDSRGEVGKYQQYLKVYQREGLSCKRCRGKVERVVHQQRSTFFCNQCQQ